MGQDRLVSLERRPLTCRVNVHHTWRRFKNEDGAYYDRCIRCGKDDAGFHGSTVGMGF